MQIDDDSDDDLLDIDAVLHAASAGAAQSVLGAARRSGPINGDDLDAHAQHRQHHHGIEGPGEYADMQEQGDDDQDEEEAQLNPLRAAYESGWRRAEREEQVLASAIKKYSSTNGM